jgi:hypothetical protein
MQARAELADAHTVTVQPGNRKITARTILVATGGRPCCPQVPGAGHAITSNEAFHLESLPKSILIVGGGYIAVEFAGIFNGLGVDTTLLYRGPKILRGFDEELRDTLTEELFKREHRRAVQRRDRSHREGLDALQGDAEGRQHRRDRPGHVRHRPLAQHQGLGLEAASVKMGEKGEIVGRRLFALLGREHLRRRRRDRPREPDSRRHPRGPRLRRYRVRQQADGSRPRPGADRRILHARDRHRRSARGRCARALPQARRLQGALQPLKHTLSGRDESMFMKAAGRRRRAATVVGCTSSATTPPRSCRWRPSRMRLEAPPRPTSTPLWRCTRARPRELVTMREKWVPPAAVPAARAQKK